MIKEKLIQELKDVDGSEYYPVFSKKRFIVKKIGEGYLLALPDNQEVTINETMMEGLEYCNGNNSFEEIVDKLFKNYDAPRNLIKNDLILTFYDAWGSGILTWKKGKNIYQNIYLHTVDDELQYMVLEPGQVHNMFMKQEKSEIYSALYKRNVKFASSKIEEAANKKGTLYCEMVKSGKTVSMLGFTPILNYLDNGRVMYYSIDYIYIDLDAGVTKSEFDAFCQWGVSFENDINKNYVFELIVDNVEMDSMLQQVGFTKVGAVGHDFYYSKQIRKVGGL